MRTKKVGRDLNVFLDAGETIHHRRFSKTVVIKNSSGKVIARFKAKRRVNDKR